MKQPYLLLYIVCFIFNNAEAQSSDVFSVKSFIAGQKDYVIQSGFRLKGKQGIVTALHGLTGTTMQFGASNERNESYGDLQIVEVDIARDVALLSSPTYKARASADLGFERNTSRLLDWQEVIIIGHPGGIYERKTSCRIGSPTTDTLSRMMVADASFSYFKNRKSPDINKTIVSVQGNFVGGHSGAPLVTMQNKVIAVVNGGILGGVPGISWAIPINDIQWQPIDQAISIEIRRMAPLQKNSPFIGQLISDNAIALDPQLENEIKFRTQQFKKVLDNLQASLLNAKKEEELYNDSIKGSTVNDVIENSKLVVVAFKLGGWISPCLVSSANDGTGTVWIGSGGYGLRHLPDQACYRYEKFERDDFTTFQLFNQDSVAHHFNDLLENLASQAESYPPEQLNAGKRWFDIWNTWDRDRIMQLKYKDFHDDIATINQWYDSIKDSYYALTNYLTQYSGGNTLK